MVYFIAVHVGAGYHSPASTKKYRKLLKRALLAGSEILQAQQGEGSADKTVAAISAAICCLEDDPITNAGYGSNITTEGNVECDASIMHGDCTFGGVGAMPCIKNPIKVAELLLHQQQAGPLPLGRVRPMFLAGEGATKHATAHLIPRVENEDLITESSLKTWRRHMALIHEHALAHQGTNQTPEEGGAERSAKRPRLERENGDILNDTVGAICVDEHGRVAAGVSSGGISVKFPGRVGEAALYGSGCWAQQSHPQAASVACSATGTGEQIMQSLLSSKCAEYLFKMENADEAVRALFENEFLSKVKDTLKHAGILALKRTLPTASKSDSTSSTNESKSSDVECLWAHTTETMGVGYYSSSLPKPKVFISRLPNGTEEGKCVQLSSVTCTI